MEHIEWNRKSIFRVTGSHLTCVWWKIKDPRSAFNNLSLTTTKKLNIQQIEKGDAISILKDSFPGNLPGIEIIWSTEAEIISIVHSPKTKQKNH